MSSMKVLVCNQPGSLSVESRDAPRSEAGHILVRPKRIGICGTDFHIFDGKHPFLKYPRVMGHELAVEVQESNVNLGVQAGDICAVNPYLACGTCITCKAGKPNCCVNISVLGVHQDGGMAEVLSLPVANLIRAPGLSVDECAAIEFLAIGAHAVRRANAGPADKALVVGAGPIGMGAALFAKLSGAEVSLFDQDRSRAKMISELLGVSAVNSSPDSTATPDKEGFDLVFDATGSARAMAGGFDYVRAGGRYVLVSVVRDSIAFSDPDFHRKELTLFGSRNATLEDFSTVISAIRSGKVPIDRIVTHRTSLESALKDLPNWAHNKEGLIKALIEID